MKHRYLLLVTPLILGSLSIMGISALAKRQSLLLSTSSMSAPMENTSPSTTQPNTNLSPLAQAEKNSDEVWALLRQAEEARFNQKLNEAVSIYREILSKLIPKRTRGLAHLSLGEILLEQKKYSEAIEAYQEANKIFPENIRTWTGQITAFIQLNDLDSAQQLVLEARQYLPKELSGLGELGYYSSLSEAYRDLGDFNESIALMERALRLNPYVANAAGCNFTIEGLKHIGIHARGTKLQYRSARCELSLIETENGPIEGWSEAKTIIYGAVEQQNVYPEAYQKTGLKELTSIIPHELFQPDTPNERWDEAMAISSLNLGIGLINRAITMGHAPSMDAAILFLKTSVKHDETYGWNRIYLSSALLAQGRPNEAMQGLEQVLALPNIDGKEPGKTWVWAHNNRGYALELQGKPEEAIREYEKAIALDPTFSTAKENLQRLVVH